MNHEAIVFVGRFWVFDLTGQRALADRKQGRNRSRCRVLYPGHYESAKVKGDCN